MTPEEELRQQVRNMIFGSRGMPVQQPTQPPQDDPEEESLVEAEDRKVTQDEIAQRLVVDLMQSAIRGLHRATVKQRASDLGLLSKIGDVRAEGIANYLREKMNEITEEHASEPDLSDQ